MPKFKFFVCLMLWALIITACSTPATTSMPSQLETPAVQPVESTATQSAEVPTQIPDTSSQAAIDAPLIEAPSLVELDMLNEMDGWAVTETQIVRTNDGVVTWYDVTPPGVEETGFAVGMFVVDNDHVWLQKPDYNNFPNSGTMYRTTDAGITWKTSTTPFSEGDLYFLDAKDGWVLAGLGVGAGSNAVAVYQTTDGGSTWEQTYINDPNSADANDSLPLGGLKSDIVPLDMQTAWVSGVTYTPGEVYLYRTDDAGHNWSQVSIEIPAGTEAFELGINKDQMEFVSRDDGFFVLHIAGDSMQSAVYVTHDSGDTWTLTPTIIDGVGESRFLSAQEMVMYNGEQFYITSDAGETWSTVAPDVVFGESFDNMEFANLNTGWVITMDPTTNHRSLYKTTDGGTTWSPVIP